MSEYQYYEFQSIDRPLTEKEQVYIASLSRRVILTPHRAVFTYSFGDFPKNPKRILQKHFDALLYLANWGTKQLAFRFPRTIIEPEMIAPYCFADTISASISKDHIVLDINVREEEGGFWVEGEGWLSALALLRRDILEGDFRTLYLAWVKAISVEQSMQDAGDTLEPRIPANLQSLSPSLRKFVELFEIDEDLIAVVSESSPHNGNALEQDVEELIGKLSRRERDDFLIKIAKGEPNIDVQLRRRLRELSLDDMKAGEISTIDRRTVAEIFAAARERTRRRNERKRLEAERARIKRLNELGKKEPQLWQQVSALIGKKQSKAYDEATKLLVEMRELAEHLAESDKFRIRINQIYEEYSNRPGLISRLRQAGLLSTGA